MTNLSNQTPTPLYLAGMLNPDLGMPGFLNSIYEDKEDCYYAAKSSKDGLVISGFDKVDINPKYLVEPPSHLAGAYKQGDLKVFGFCFPNGHMEVGTRQELTDQLKKRFSSLKRHPLAQLEVAGFLQSKRLVASAVKNSMPYQISSYKGDISRVILDLSETFDIEPSALRTFLALDFAKGLLSYYKLFNRLIHVSDFETRNKLSYRFRAATEYIVPFLLSEALIEELRLAPKEQTQIEIPLLQMDKSEQFDLSLVLRRLGVSAAAAEKYVNNASSEDRKPHALSVEDIVSARNSLINLSFRDAYLHKSLSRLEKKRKKEEMDDEFMSLVFSLSLILSQDLKIARLASRHYESVKSAISSSVNYFSETT